MLRSKQPSYTQYYSDRIASSGFNSEARRAGNIPVRYPTTAENNAMKIRNDIGKENNVTAFPPN